MSQYSSKWIKVTEPYPHVLHIELARGPVNAFNVEYWKAYGKVFADLVADGFDVRVAVVSSVFPKIFTAGLDRACTLFHFKRVLTLPTQSMMPLPLGLTEPPTTAWTRPGPPSQRARCWKLSSMPSAPQNGRPSPLSLLYMATLSDSA